MPPVHRIEVRAAPGRADPRGELIARRARDAGVEIASAVAARVYFIQADLTPEQIRLVRERLLTDPVTESSSLDAADPAGRTVVEVHPLPGVMDPAAQSVREAIEALVGVRAEVSTGARYDLAGATPAQARELARRWLANPAIHAIHADPWTPADLPRGRDVALVVREVPIRDLDDEALASMSRRAHLFLSLDEMRAVRDHYRDMRREPREAELETIAQTWSEHCVHKTLKSTIHYRDPRGLTADTIRWAGRPGHAANPDGSITIDNLLKSTVAAATFELIRDGVDWTLSVFKDNSGVIALDDQFGVCVKVETHNHPSAIEPYGGAATGAGGCIRDVIGTGLGAKPIACTDVFCVAHPDRWNDAAGVGAALPPGCLHPRRILTDVVAGVRDYGNRMGIPTVNGAVAFDDRYIGNPLVFCGCVGLIPRGLVSGKAHAGDRIILLGGRTGRDGIHGATFSSAELEHTAADEFAHAVQIGNAIEEKRLLDAILRARDHGHAPLFHAITDCGAGGLSSAIGEMGSELGAAVRLDRVPTKYAGLSATEIWISEAQERMVLAVPPANLAPLRAICQEEQVDLADLGEFGTPGRELVLSFAGTEVGRLSCEFLAEGLPQPTRQAVWSPAPPPPRRISRPPAIADLLPRLLAHPNIASKHWIVRQYDHEVQGNVILKPLVGPRGIGPADASVIEPIPGSGRGVAIGCGLRTPLGSIENPGTIDPYRMALAAIDECVRNLVCVGANPERIAILDNFCWPSCQRPDNLASLVRAAEGCYDGAKAYRTPFVSGKDSLNNQLRYVDDAGRERLIEIPPTLLITGIGIVPDVSRCVTMDAKRAGNLLVRVGPRCPILDGSHAAAILGDAERDAPTVDLDAGPAAARRVARVIARGLARAAHDASDGGLITAVAEMLIAAQAPAQGLGAELELEPDLADAFGEAPSRYVLEVEPASLDATLAEFVGTPVQVIGRITASPRLTWKRAALDAPVETLARAWRGTLDW